MALSRPGVYITEGPFTTNAAVGPQVTPAAFFGTVARGPIGPTRIDSWNQYKSLYGDLTNTSDLGYSVYQFFANGGRSAYINRIAHTTTAQNNAAAVTAKSGPITGTIGSSTSVVTLFKVQAKSPGTWANWVASSTTTPEIGLKVVLTPGQRDGIPETVNVGGDVFGKGAPRTFNLFVYFNGVEVERWTEVSLDPDSAQYILNIVNTYSIYANVVEVDAGLTAGVDYTLTGLTYGNPSSGSATYKVGDATVSGDVEGTNGTVVDADWIAAVDALDTVPGALLINLVGQTSKSLVDKATTYSETRGNAFVIIDPSKTLLTSAAITGLTDTYNKSSYGAVYYPVLKMPDPARSGSATLRDTFPGGAIAGLFSRVEQERTVAKAPAGYAYDIRNAYALTTNFTEASIGLLYDSNVNTMKNIPGGGIIINGARTLKRTDITKYVPVRRSLNYIKHNVETIANYALFEPNGERVWTDINNRIWKFLADFWGAGGLKGRNVTEAFYIICDSTNNTTYTIENGELHVEVGVALQSPAEFIVINVSQFAGSSNTTAETI
jgi:phage tail sheath protein FI